jgi:hypothetical protein
VPWTKKRLWSFSDKQGGICTNYSPKRAVVIDTVIATALRRFVKILMKKRPDMAAGDRYSTKTTTFVLTADTVLDYLAAMNIKTISQPPYSPVMETADYFLFTIVKAELAAIFITQEPFQGLGWGTLDHH